MIKIFSRLRSVFESVSFKWQWLAAVGLGAGLITGVVGLTTGQPYALAGPKVVFAQSDMPVNNWVVCADLGIGPVPGIADIRQRFRLCHDSGWRIKAYCLDVYVPAPGVGTECTRVSETRYNCGRGFQELREYAVLQTPAPVPTETFAVPPTEAATSSPTSLAAAETSAPTPKPTQNASATPWARGLPGGPVLFNWHKVFYRAGSTPTPFQPATATMTPFMPDILPTNQALPAEPVFTPWPYRFDGADLAPGAARIRLRVYPQAATTNHGKPVQISFSPGEMCSFGDQRGCVNAFITSSGSQAIIASIHSGVGGEGQPLRQALEGTFLYQAAWRLPRVRSNLQAFSGAEVVITQAEWESSGFLVVGAARLPSKAVQEYLHTPLPDILAMIASYNPHLEGRLQPDRPVLVIETCGWRLPGEAPGRGTTLTSASIYLLLIQPKY